MRVKKPNEKVRERYRVEWERIWHRTCEHHIEVYVTRVCRKKRKKRNNTKPDQEVKSNKKNLVMVGK